MRPNHEPHLPVSKFNTRLHFPQMAFINPGLGVLHGFPRANAAPSFSTYSLLEGESSHFMEGESKA